MTTRTARQGGRGSLRVLARRAVVVAVVCVQLVLVARGYWSAHKEFAFQMFPESSTWQADIVRVTTTGARVPVDEPWFGYRWADLVPDRGMASPDVRHHADSGLDNQLAFLAAAINWVADHTPRDTETRYLEAVVTTWHNTDPARVVVIRSHERGPLR